MDHCRPLERLYGPGGRGQPHGTQRAALRPRGYAGPRQRAPLARSLPAAGVLGARTGILEAVSAGSVTTRRDRPSRGDTRIQGSLAIAIQVSNRSPVWAAEFSGDTPCASWDPEGVYSAW